jgi:hypothetical protein
LEPLFTTCVNAAARLVVPNNDKKDQHRQTAENEDGSVIVDWVAGAEGLMRMSEQYCSLLPIRVLPVINPYGSPTELTVTTALDGLQDLDRRSSEAEELREHPVHYFFLPPE